MNTERAMSKFASANGYNHISNEKTIDLITKIDDELGDFYSNGYIENYERNAQHGLGYSKKYNYGEMIWVDVYAFHGRQKDLQDGVKSSQLKQMYDGNLSAFADYYANIKNKKDQTVSYQGIEFKKHSFTGENTKMGKEVESMMFLTIYDSTFLKVRIDYYTGYEQGDTDVDAFMNALATDLKK